MKSNFNYRFSIEYETYSKSEKSEISRKVKVKVRLAGWLIKAWPWPLKRNNRKSYKKGQRKRRNNYMGPIKRKTTFHILKIAFLEGKEIKWIKLKI